MASKTYVWTSKLLTTTELVDLYEWLDRIPLSKRKSQVEKDFADGTLAGEIISKYFPEMIELNSYQPYQNIQERMTQWSEMNVKVFSKLGLTVPSHVIKQLSIGKTGITQLFLHNLRACLAAAGGDVVGLPELKAEFVPNNPTFLNSIPPNMYADSGTMYADSSAYKDSLWAKYDVQNRVFKNMSPIKLTSMSDNEFDYFWHKKQVNRAKNGASPTLATGAKRGASERVAILQTDIPVLISSRSQPNMPNMKGNKSPTSLPFIQNPYAQPHIVYAAAAKLELDNRNREVASKNDEIGVMKEKVKRLESIISSKNTRIQELTLIIEKNNFPQTTTTNSGDKKKNTPANNKISA